jgi:hypothetical protein
LSLREFLIVAGQQRQMRIEFENQISLVLTHADQIPLAARLIEFLRAGKEASR